MVLDSISKRLREARAADGGFGTVAGSASEPEPTALTAIAVGDAGAVAWLEQAQEEDGSFGVRVGTVFSDDTALASLALPGGDARERALDHLERVSGRSEIDGAGPPPYGWPWTDGAYGWTEPTAWGLLALRANRPGAVERIDDGLATLRARECPGGGWNYGTPRSFGVDEPPFVQTTAVALLALAGADDALADRGRQVLRQRWRSESAGVLSLATATAALRSLHDPEADAASDVLRSAIAVTPDADTVALAWAAIALGPGLMSLSP